MNKKIYLAPRAQAYEIKTEGVIAESLKIGTQAGEQQLSNQKEMDDFGGWASSEEYWK